MIATVVPAVDDFIRAHGDRAEFAQGAVLEKPMPNGPHSDCQIVLGSELRSYARKTGKGRARSEWHHRFGAPDDIRLYVPDLVFVFAPDKADLPEYANRASELMIEIFSPSMNPADLLDKLQFYLANGAKSVWMVYPEKKRVDVFKPNAPREIFSGDTVLTDPLLPGFELPLSALFE